MSLITAAPPPRSHVDRRAVPATPVTPRVAPRARSPWTARLGLGLIGAGVALLPWLFVLATGLPATATASHWRVAWVGFDTLEALSFVATGVLVIRRDARACLTAMVTATLLVADAWFDVSTAAPGADQMTAVAMAVLLEVPLAVFSVVLAWRTLPRSR
ncbi:hypothetical protein [Actinoallomurus rhizosphaericola]|uniref:hypothetical protein n=1 Tax=Actinoallomurus rhizosphaericola TaxID=2952536 RepID=UPI00209247D3|nr:hypothetical protein [Actinoallomurus rhizosphaericola]MCO5994828.1 hypothetical protein [Actinoallomurus rhizosphaericola]